MKKLPKYRTGSGFPALFLQTALIGSTASFAAPPAGLSSQGAMQVAFVVAASASLAAVVFAWLWLQSRRKPVPSAAPIAGGSEIVESARDAIFVIEDNGAIVSCNDSAESLFGFAIAELRGKSISSLIPPPERGRRRGNYIHSAEGRVLNGIRKSGQNFPLDLMLSELPSSNGKRFSLIVRDRSERTRAERELEAQNKFSSDVLDELPALVVVADHEGRILRFNRACEDLTQFSEGEVRGQTVWQALAAPASMEAAEADYHRLIENELPARAESVWCLRDGSLRRIEWTHTALRDEIGRLTYLISVGGTVAFTGNTAPANGLQESLDAAARMAGGVAHDFNNLLTTISGYSGLLLGSLDPAHPARRDVDEIRKAGDRAAILTRQLLAFSGKLPRQPEQVSLNDVVNGAVRILRSLIAESGIHLDISLDAELPVLTLDPRQLEECILHLTAGARDAMPDGGTLQLETATRTVSRRRNDARPALEPGDYVTLSVVHTGMGIPPSLLPHIFEPFSATREFPKSNGMGLAIAYGIVRQNGGSIMVQSAPGCGATYRIYFPAAAAVQPAPLDEPEAALETIGGDETILVATENDRDRRRMRDALQQAGYFVLEARSALQAMEIAHKAPDAIHLAICDIQVPRMSGPELAATLRGIRSEIRSLYASSKSEDEMRRQGMEPSSVLKIDGLDEQQFLLEVRQRLSAPAARRAAG